MPHTKTAAHLISHKGMSGAVLAGDIVFVAGQVPVRPDGTTLVGTIEEQAELCFDNIEAELAAFGATLDDLVEVTAFVAHPFDIDGYLAVRTARFSKDHPPATTTVMATLGSPQWRVEVKAVAVLGAWK